MSSDMRKSFIWKIYSDVLNTYLHREAAGFSETSAHIYKTALRRVSEDGCLCCDDKHLEKQLGGK
jgi:hypothetical protein